MRKVTSEDSTAIAFDQSGQGPALILVGGAFQHRAIDPRTAQLAALLASHFTVFHEAGGPAFVFDMSSGGVLALEAAARGLAITKVALYEPPFNTDDNARAASENYTKQLTALLAEGRRGDAVALAMTTFGAPAEAVAGMRGTPI
jgi:alpha-beta hydrolase superfamily lysophospholipase